jgi:TatD DNase family protein
MIDTHCHLSHDRFRADRDAVLERARAAGVTAVVEVGWDLASSRAAIELARRHPGTLFPTAGIHPHYVAAAPAGAIAELRALAAGGALVAIGETGLDFYRNLSPRDRQEELFRAHIRLAREFALPLVVHSREATARTLEILAAEAGAARGAGTATGAANGAGGVLHCFSGNRAEAQEAVDRGFLLGFGGTLTYGDDELRAVARAVPAAALLLETDAPYLAPAPRRRERNEPAWMAAARERLAAIRGVSPAEIDRITTENARRLFRLPVTAAAAPAAGGVG